MEFVSGIFISTGVLLTHGLLTLSFIALWVPYDLGIRYTPIWFLTFIFCILAAVLCELVTPVAIIVAAIFGWACYLFRFKTSHILQVLIASVIILMSIGLLSHLFPGFINPKIIANLEISPDAVLYSRYLNLDKPLIGLFILALTHRRISTIKEWKNLFIFNIHYPFIITAVVLMLALLMQGIRIDVKFNRLFFLWGWINLFYTCIAEEAFFRGFLQRNIVTHLARFKYGKIGGLLITSILFGTSHYAGGINYIILSTIAGIGYGLVYERTKMIEASILTHFFLNAVHFIFFTYPALAK